MNWDTEVDVVIITALRKEFDALKGTFPQLESEDYCCPIGIRRYYAFDFVSPTKESSIKLAFVWAEGMGRISAALATRDAIHDWTPEYIILVGFAAGDPNATDPKNKMMKGHVAYAEKVIDYEIQKIGKKVDWRPQESDWCSTDFLRAADDVKESHWTKEIEERKLILPDGTTEIKAHRVKVACGDKVVKNPKWRDKLLRELGKTRPDLRVIEMESGGVSRAIYEMPDKKKPDFFMIKGICDYADYDKNDRDQIFAATAAGIFLRQCLIRFMALNKDRYSPRKRTRIIPRYKPIAYLEPSKNALRMFDEYPKDLCCGWRETMIDGAIEILFCPSAKNKYGGFTKNKIQCEVDDSNEWPRDATLDNLETRISEFAKGLTGINEKTRGWLGDRKVAPNRIRRLLNVPTDPVLDRQELFLRFGNSDYFTVRTVQEVSRRGRESTLGGTVLSNIFPTRWGESGIPFPANCVPYHVSAQGILVCSEPGTRNKYLILTSDNPLGNTLVSGWSATMAEQMWAPEPTTRFTPWWQHFTTAIGIQPEPHEERQGDKHIQDTLIRGLEEEFGLKAGVHYPVDPKLLNVCLEEDMYFVTFIFFVPVEISLEELYSLWLNAPDHKEMGLLAAYQVEGLDENGNEINGPMRMADILAMKNFDGSKYLIKNPTEMPLIREWHITSRMRIYLAAHHLYGKRIAEYVLLK